ncbi:MAG: Acetohydroxy acid isomeroreductase, catalytic domain [Anaerosporomusa subterranea]|nr:Acetohydroxy acid isomeroreductase, catalytic domain [Anaerosporomusa subterranea]
MLLLTEATLKEMKQILAEVQDDTFAKMLIAENEYGRPNFSGMRASWRFIELLGIKNPIGLLTWR